MGGESADRVVGWGAVHSDEGYGVVEGGDGRTGDGWRRQHRPMSK